MACLGMLVALVEGRSHRAAVTAGYYAKDGTGPPPPGGHRCTETYRRALIEAEALEDLATIGAAEGEVDLTERGRRVRTVVVAAMVGEVCSSDDWRGSLPRFIARAMPQARVVKWRSRGSSRLSSTQADDETCNFCTPAGERGVPDAKYLGLGAGVEAVGGQECRESWAQLKQARRWSCAEYLSDRGVTADVVLVVGTGQEVQLCREQQQAQSPEAEEGACVARRKAKERFPSLAALMQVPWLRNDTLIVHIPVRRVKALRNNYWGFDQVIHDHTFMKPLQQESVLGMRDCHAHDKVNDLIYVGRFDKPEKGQAAFLKRADPDLLAGFTVHFYGAKVSAGREAIVALQELAVRRGIRVQVHGEVPKRELLAHVCRAAGQLHYAMRDDNPRAAYEGIYAGNPLLVTEESNVAKELRQQPFVVSTGYQRGGLNADLARFMRMVRQTRSSHAARNRIFSFAKDRMLADHVNLELCQRMGLCAHTNQSMAKLERLERTWAHADDILG